MHRVILAVVLFWSLDLSAQMLQVHGKDMFVNGMNIPWRHFGKDFGGVGRERYDSSYFERTFAKLNEQGANAVRIWLHCDARYSPFFDRTGLVSGLPSTFIEDFLDFLDRAERHHLLVIPVLWTFELAERRNRNTLINELAVLQSYIDHALIPLLTATRDRCNILAWEIMNEPEWAMNIPRAGTTKTTFSPETLQRFVGMQANAIHEHSEHKVTVGSAGLRFLTNNFFQAHNYWHDTELQAQNIHCPGAHLDFYSVHYYRWTLEPLSPFKQSWYELDIDKPVLIGEFGLDKKRSTFELMETAHKNGFAGTMPWSMNANDGVGNWQDYSMDVQRFSNENKSLMPQFPMCTTTDMNSAFISCLLFPNPADQIIHVHNPNPADVLVHIELVSLLGSVSKTWRNQTGEEIQLDVSDCPNGSYVVRIYSKGHDGMFRQRSRQKLMIVRS